MIRALFTAATGMQAQQLNVDVIAHNLANVNTTGFKRGRADFQDLLYQNLRQAGAASSNQSEIPTGIQLGLGTRAAAVQRLFLQGDFQHTQNQLDMAIDGDGFFQILHPNGDVVYSRAGAFKAISYKEITSLGFDRLDNNVPLGQFRMSCQSLFDRSHHTLAERTALFIGLMAQINDRVESSPSHRLGPLQHRFDVNQFRPIPMQLQDAPTSLNWIVFTVIGWVIQQLNRLPNVIDELHHPLEKLRATAATFGAIIHLDLQDCRSRLGRLIQGVPSRFQRIDNEIARLV
jgi:flagellar basal body rod protein FlgB